MAGLAAAELAASAARGRLPALRRWTGRLPVLVVEDGRCLPDRLREAGLDEADVLDAARRSAGVERLDQVRYALLDAGGGITIVPR